MRRREPTDMCRCGHQRGTHEHYSAATYCGICGRDACRSFRRPWKADRLIAEALDPPVPPASDSPDAQAAAGARAGRPVAPGPRRTVWRCDLADCGCVRTYDFNTGARETIRCDWHSFDVAAWNARLQA